MLRPKVSLRIGFCNVSRIVKAQLITKKAERR